MKDSQDESIAGGIYLIIAAFERFAIKQYLSSMKAKLDTMKNWVLFFWQYTPKAQTGTYINTRVYTYAFA